jgi:hypothetical protein
MASVLQISNGKAQLDDLFDLKSGGSGAKFPMNFQVKKFKSVLALGFLPELLSLLLSEIGALPLLGRCCRGRGGFYPIGYQTPSNSMPLYLVIARAV